VANKLRNQVLAHSPKKNRHRRENLNTNKYKVQPHNGYYRRARYFKVYRPERIAMKSLENTFSLEFNHTQYRTIRYIYYVIIPRLARCLWYPPDRVRLQDLEIDYFNQLLSQNFNRGRHREPDRVPIWSYRSPTYKVGGN
jgi:hypothetical protein